MRFFVFFQAFVFLFTIINCQVVDDNLKALEAQIKQTEDVKKISDIITQNNKLVEDNIRKFDDSTRKKITAVLTNQPNNSTNTTKTDPKPNAKPIKSNSDKNDMSIFLLLVCFLQFN